jgi:two-component system, response regulator PdtaR
VLVVSDDGGCAASIARALSEHGFDVSGVARSAVDAIGLAADRRPELAVVDVALSGEIDGIETARLLRERFALSIVFVAAEAEGKTRARACAVEPEALLLKPVRATDLVRVAERATTRDFGGGGLDGSPLGPENRRVLVVDDEYRVRFSIANTLSTVRCEVRQAGSAEAALEVLSRDREFDLVLCDMMMPQMTGAELFDRLLHEHPHLARRFAFVSAGATNVGDEAAMRSKGVRLLLKPFTPEDLLAFVGEQLSHAAD